jgi:hypothetical protein
VSGRPTSQYASVSDARAAVGLPTREPGAPNRTRFEWDEDGYWLAVIDVEPPHPDAASYALTKPTPVAEHPLDAAAGIGWPPGGWCW